MLTLALLCLAGCGAMGKPEEETTAHTEQATEAATEQARQPAPPVELPEGYAFTSTWAKTPACFYGIAGTGRTEDKLCRVLFSSIGTGVEIALPGEYNHYRICGVSPEGLYIYAWNYRWDDGAAANFGAVYLFPHESGQSKLLLDGEDMFHPWYNPMGNALLYFRGGDKPRVEALLNNGEQKVVFEDEALFDRGYAFDVWFNLEDGSVAARASSGPQVLQAAGYGPLYDLLCFDSRNQAWPKALKEAHILDNRDFTQIEYLTDDEMYWRWQWERDDIKSIVIGDAIVGLMVYGQEEEDGPGWDDVKLCRLGSDGEILEVILETTQGENNGFHMSRLDDMVLLTEFRYGDGEWICFYALYDPATGALFSAE